MRILIIPIALIPNHQLLKHHLITSECSRLIRQYILNLAQLLIDTHTITLQRPIIHQTNHILVFLHEIPLEDLNEL